jgi:hypothetical protein
MSVPLTDEGDGMFRLPPGLFGNALMDGVLPCELEVTALIVRATLREPGAFEMRASQTPKQDSAAFAKATASVCSALYHLHHGHSNKYVARI